MDSIDQHWVTLNEGAQEEAEKEEVTVDYMAPNTKDDAQQIECVNNAIAGGYQAIIVAANGPDAISGSLKEAQAAGIKIVYVDSPANVDAEATFSTDNKAGGEKAGEELKKALEDKGVTSGSIGIINTNAASQSTLDREAGFRGVFEDTDFEVLETQYSEGDAAKSQSIAENYITQGFDKSDTILNLVKDGYLVCTMAQNPDVMGAEGVKAAVKAINGEDLGGEVTDTGVSVIKADDVEE